MQMIGAIEVEGRIGIAGGGQAARMHQVVVQCEIIASLCRRRPHTAGHRGSQRDQETASIHILMLPKAACSAVICS